jgi:DNA-3-methyladenine glycosylase II
VALLTLPQPFDFELSTKRFRAFGNDLANVWHEGGLHRVVGGREVRIEAAPVGVDVSPLDRETEPVVRKLLGLEHDLAAYSEFATGSDDPVLVKVVPALAGFRPPVSVDPFEAIVGAITAQQVSLHAATAIRNRLIERYGERVQFAYSFPTADRLAQADEEELFALGFSRHKAEYVIGLARNSGDLDGLAGLSEEDVKTRIQSIRGLGEWTADWFLARYLVRPRAWPAGDLGLRRAVEGFYGGGGELTTEEVRAIGARFDPFQNLTAHYLLTASRVLPWT